MLENSSPLGGNNFISDKILFEALSTYTVNQKMLEMKMMISRKEYFVISEFTCNI